RRRHTPQTSGPCRLTRAANAASSRRSTKHPRSCPSVSPAPSCCTVLRRCWMILLVWLVAMSLPRRPIAPALYLLSAERRPVDTHFFDLVGRGKPRPRFEQDGTGAGRPLTN